jgi:sugar phosphate isomerase/epimerase
VYISLQSTLVAGRVKWPAFAELAHRLGYPGTDVSLREALPFGVAGTRDLLDKLHLTPAVVDLPVEFRKDDDTFRADLAKLDDAVQFAVGIGCPRMTTYIMSSSETPKLELRKIYKTRFTACANVLGRSHCRLGLEFLGPLHIRTRFPHEFIWRMNEMLEFARECGPNVGLLLDSWHWHHAGATAADIVAAGKDSIVHVQVNDSADLPPETIRDNERLMPGEGVINLIAFFQALKEIGYADGVSPEVFGRGLKDIPPEEGAKMGLDTTRAVMRKAGVA